MRPIAIIIAAGFLREIKLILDGASLRDRVTHLLGFPVYGEAFAT